MFLKHEQKILDIVQLGTAGTNSRQDRLTQKIKDNSTRLDIPGKKLEGLKLSVEASQERMEKKIEKAEGKVNHINSKMTWTSMNYGKRMNFYVKR